jgi:hypothetical protein
MSFYSKIGYSCFRLLRPNTLSRFFFQKLRVGASKREIRAPSQHLTQACYITLRLTLRLDVELAAPRQY